MLNAADDVGNVVAGRGEGIMRVRVSVAECGREK
jgi:hypothetical protein